MSGIYSYSKQECRVDLLYSMISITMKMKGSILLLQGSAGPWLDRFGSSLDQVQENRTSSREYIRVVRPTFAHFPLVFLSLLTKFLHSLCSAVFFSDGGGGRRQPPMRRLAAMDGGAATPNTPFLYFFFVLSTPFHTFTHFSLEIPETHTQTSKSKKREKENYTSY